MTAHWKRISTVGKLTCGMASRLTLVCWVRCAVGCGRPVLRTVLGLILCIRRLRVPRKSCIYQFCMRCAGLFYRALSLVEIGWVTRCVSILAPFGCVFAEGSAAGGHGGPSDDLAIELPPMPWRVHWIATPDNPDATATAAIEACRAKLADKTIDADQVSKHYFTCVVILCFSSGHRSSESHCVPQVKACQSCCQR